MKITYHTRESFNRAVCQILEIMKDKRWPQPIVYAEEIDGEMRFGACNRSALGGSEIVWTHVEHDTFGELSGDYQEDADGIEVNMYDRAVLCVLMGDANLRMIKNQPFEKLP